MGLVILVFTSMGLNLTLWMVSTPQVKLLTGSALCSSQISTCSPQVANTALLQ